MSVSAACSEEVSRGDRVFRGLVKPLGRMFRTGLLDSGALAWLTPGSLVDTGGATAICGIFGIPIRSRGGNSVVPGTRRAFDPDESTLRSIP
jgi:hypothetical protein